MTGEKMPKKKRREIKAWIGFTDDQPYVASMYEWGGPACLIMLTFKRRKDALRRFDDVRRVTILIEEPK